MFPTVEAVTAASAEDAKHGVPRRVAPLAYIIRAEAPTRPLDLLEPSISVSIEVHPYIAEQLSAVKRLKNGDWSLPVKRVEDALCALRTDDVVEHADLPGVFLLTTGTRTARLHVRGTATTLLHFDDAEALLAASSIPVFDASRGAFNLWSSLRETSLVARTQPSSPNLARLVDGRRTERVLSCSDAFAVLDAEFDRAIACDPFVAELAALAHSGRCSDAVLLPVQQQAVGRYLASANGIVCALPPGSGKTVVAARALHHSEESALIVAPSGLHHQWVAELARFAPSATVKVIATKDDLRLLASHLTTSRAVVVISPRLLLLAPRVQVDALVVDEAAFLRSSSKQTRALREQRAMARRTLLLTGTPGERRTADVGALVAFVLGDHSLFAGAPLGIDWRDRVGPLTFEAGEIPELPPATRELVLCQPSANEAALLAAASEALAKARAELAAAERAGTLQVLRLRALAHHAFERARLAATDAVGISQACTEDLLQQLASRVPTPAKRTALVELCSDGVSTVVCCDSTVVAQMLAEHLSFCGVRAGALTGELTHAVKERTVKALGSTLDVLIVSKAGQTGWNMQSASRLIHYDVPLTAQTARQREGRVRRLGGSAVRVVCLALSGAIDAESAQSWAADSPDRTGV
jgi:superfamily II DNA or RNA helicase